MKILFVCHGIGNGGAERVLTVLANHMSVRGYEVTIITTNPHNNDYELEESIKHICVYKYYHNAVKRVFFRIKGIKTAIHNTNPDCIISFSAVCNIQVLMAIFFKRMNIIISERTDPSRFPEGNIYRFLRKILYHKASAIVFQTEEARNYFSSRIRRKGIIIPNPIREKMPYPVIERSSNRIIGVGALCEQKNWFVSLKACEIFFEKYPEYIFEIYGEGNLREKIQNSIDNSNVLRNRVFLRDFCREIEKKYVDALIYISSSDYEGISNSMLEALALGTPSICTDCPVGGARMIITNGQNGILVPVGDSKAMADAMERIAFDEEFRRHLSEKAIEVREEYGENAIGQKWEDLVKRIVGEKDD